ncbi:putative secreted protease [Streptomyces scabiei 87.22]|uniref:Putative secreted protease n=1 Tax=Streptomyces scabiei (strain 87.22) TaxID=680198 RepID=C9Z082_STRSW|nr:S1 family peptidase [Streptomyces sp. LBUM 1485]MBP5880114.1 S1 family peptidase [Streptomyces sp. LBUM 1477]MBP5889464.1 S1 family peptidase [Streptomyces sp. LBUM 1481]MBP5903961.1 S1 family peptidase [Streptomyces sp. LBUM 1488]MBP5912348.1 S1 family peptidase [Streptomyces sp. LBUM 1486]MBP5919492.1 S1 family peptidase [Streptomyces sp. LBUM 1483]QTU51419.1 S1 family peptidase [Streptomyces sp. LBUM 1482]QTU59540.1 S1 family peptidase [Streptomyces sp. LBUM 1480]QTU67607.1 S1 family 
MKRVARLTAAGGLICGTLMVAQAAMATEPTTSPPTTRSAVLAASGTGNGLVGELGSERTAGTWIADDGKPVVAVTDEEAAAEVERAGARPKMVEFSGEDLESAAKALRSAPRVSGTSWAIDPASNEVVVRADSTVSKKDWSSLTDLAEKIGASVRMERTEGTYTMRLNGAQPIFGTGGRCSIGFNVTDGERDFMLTAGHCGPAGSVWFSDNEGRQEIGRTTESEFPGSDYSLVQYLQDAPSNRTNVVSVGDGRGVRITSVGEAAVGQRVFRSGSTSGFRNGEVTGLDATVNYPEGTVSGLIETTVCAEPGDSGGPLFSEGVALGVTSGGNGDCKEGGTTFFQPLSDALDDLGVRLTGLPQSAAQPTAAADGSSGDDSQGAAAPGGAEPGSVEPVDSVSAASDLLDRLADPRNVGPGLLVVAGSMVALAATRFIRTEQDRQAYRRQYSGSWG